MNHVSSTPQLAHNRPDQHPNLPETHWDLSCQRVSTPAKWVSIGVSLGLHLGLLLLPYQTEPIATPSKQIRVTQWSKQVKLSNQVKTITAPHKVLKPQKPLKAAAKPLPRRPAAPSIPQPNVSSTQSTQSQSTQSQSTQSQIHSNSRNWDDFPLYPDAQPGCFALSSCFQTAASLQQLSNFYTRALPAQTYDVKQVLSEDDRQVFRVSRGGQSQFLSVLQSQNGSVYVLSNEPRSLEDLKKAVEVPPELITLLGDLNAQNAVPGNFSQPDLFYRRSPEQASAGKLVPKAGIRYISLVPGHAATTLMDEVFRANLQTNDFEITDLPQPFGNGTVYQVKKGDVLFYLNLVPTHDNASTVVVVWKNRPE